MALKMRLAVSWPLCLVVLLNCVRAVPSVNVALQASFGSAPYLLELLETTAEENSTSYFPLLDRIADGAFDDAITEKDLYNRFLKVVEEDGHLRTPESLSSFKLSLALRSATPRIQAHYQHYNDYIQPFLVGAQDAACPLWIHYDGKQYCTPNMVRAQQDVATEMDNRELPLDRVLGDAFLPPAILYADVTSPMFKEYHQMLSALAREGQVSYRVRYRPPQHWSSRPLFVSGYGVELALKRTDYIVIDDRDAEKRAAQADGAKDSAAEDSKEDTHADLKPLSASEVARLGFHTASYVMDSADPLDTLVEVLQDFPRYSSFTAGHNSTVSMLKEIRVNRGQLFPPGYNIMWINGIQIEPRRMDPFSLLDHLRRERQLLDRFKALGLTATEAVQLLSHDKVSGVQDNDQPQRFDYHDEIEGGRVIIWLNDIEKDERYKLWPSDLNALLQRTFPGQVPAVRRDLHNAVFPVDLATSEGMALVVETIQGFVQRKVPVRFGLVPTTSSPGSIGHLKIAHYLQETFGLKSLIRYLEESFKHKKIASPDKSCFLAATKDMEPRDDRETISFEEILVGSDFEDLVSRAVNYQNRLGVDGESPLLFINGVPIDRNVSWLQAMSMQMDADLLLIQQAIIEGGLEADTWLPGFLLAKAFHRRRLLIIPENTKDVKIADLAQILTPTSATVDGIPCIRSLADNVLDSAHVIVVGDFDSDAGSALLTTALEFRDSNPEIEMLFLHNPLPLSKPNGAASKLYQALSNMAEVDIPGILRDLAAPKKSNQAAIINQAEEMNNLLTSHQDLAGELGFRPGMNGLVVSGRTVFIPLTAELTQEDLALLIAYERAQRISPIKDAMMDVGIGSKLGNAQQFAKLTSLILHSAGSDHSRGGVDASAGSRVDPSKKWLTEHSVIRISKSEDPFINVVAAIDPASEAAQRLAPILKVLSKLAGVSLKILLNPQEEIQELPVKRYYRYVLDSEPSFELDGSLVKPKAIFTGVPVAALLTLGMDVPSSWLVAPKESIHDLDNIKLSSVKSGSDVDAIYELEHILIEGHSRDVTLKSPPRGVQLLLGTESNPHFADTIIMANLGYFQFKAQPGLWKIQLKPGRSQRIFNLDSAGALGYNPQSGDENNEVALLSFQGKTLFPRLSRKKGYEEEDVLEVGPKANSAMNYVSRGLNLAQSVLSNVGVSPTGTSAEKHADINIFSVASGHLYERMLNIMMVSVMKHTKHSVKFWFIEQFLSPSFKSFLPHVANEYGFSYEMVTYKWPHWLRAQQEKQREIWGYKILFLDVLFPLSLDKVIFVDADQIVRTDMYDLVQLDLEGAPYGFTPMCDSREEMEGFRFWKQGYWKSFLRGRPYHISALYVVDLNRFRALAAGDRLRGQYQMLSADPASLSNLDQDLPNHMQFHIPIKSLPQEWLWCETWCSDEALAQARTIDLCNNPLTKEPKLDRARRQVPEWTAYDDKIAALSERVAREAQQETGDADAYEEDDGPPGGDHAWNKDEL